MIITKMMILMIDYYNALRIQQRSYSMVMIKSKEDCHGLTQSEKLLLEIMKEPNESISVYSKKIN